MLKTRPLNKVPGYERWQLGTDHANGDFAIDCHDINRGQYDVVISVNISLPTDVVMSYPQTLFAYMIGEANMAMGKARFGYDITMTLNGSDLNWKLGVFAQKEYIFEQIKNKIKNPTEWWCRQFILTYKYFAQTSHRKEKYCY